MQTLVTEDWHTLYGDEYCFEKDDTIKQGPKVGFRERIKHFTWPWFISTMSTGGLAIVLAQTPHRFRGK
jgi:hypothetical protein